MQTCLQGKSEPQHKKTFVRRFALAGVAQVRRIFIDFGAELLTVVVSSCMFLGGGVSVLTWRSLHCGKEYLGLDLFCFKVLSINLEACIESIYTSYKAKPTKFIYDFSISTCKLYTSSTLLTNHLSMSSPLNYTSSIFLNI